MCSEDVQPSTSGNAVDSTGSLQKIPLNFYPEGHPMNDIKELEDNLFNNLNNDITPLNKRRKIMRRLEKKQNKLIAQERELLPCDVSQEAKSNKRTGSLWDVKEKVQRQEEPHSSNLEQKLIGPKKKTMYTVRDNKIVRLEPSGEAETGEQDHRAVDIVIPENEAESQLLEGTKINVDDIRKIDRFKNYEPGIPSKVYFNYPY